MCVLVAQLCLTLCDPWTVAHQVPLSMGFSRQGYWSVGCHFLLQGIFPTQGLNLGLLHFWQILYCLSYQGSPYWSYRLLLVLKSIYTVRTLGFVGKCLPKPGVQSGPENAPVKLRPGAFLVFHRHF